MTARPAHHAWYCHGDNHSLQLAWKTTRHAPPAACVVPVASRHDFRVYAAGYADEEDPCVEVRGVVVGGCRTGQGDCSGSVGGCEEVSVLWRCLCYI